MVNTMKKMELSEEERKVVEALNVFGPLPRNILCEYITDINSLSNPATILHNLHWEKYLYAMPKKITCDYSLWWGFPRSILKIAAFSSIISFTGGKDLTIDRAKEPFDFVFGHNNEVYVGILFQEEGIYKMNYKNCMKGKAIPFIILLNGDVKRLQVKNEKGEYYLLPEEDYYVANVQYVNDENKGEVFIPSIVKYKGGTTSEIK